MSGVIGYSKIGVLTTGSALAAPDDISGLTAWYDASQEAYANNDSVSSLTDQSGSGNTMSQAFGSLQPIFQTNQFPSGKPGVVFDGVDDYLKGTNPASSVFSNTAITVFTVFKAVSIGTAGANVYDNDTIWGELTANLALTLDPTAYVQAYNYDGTVDQINTSISTGTAYVHMMRHETGSIYASLNGGAESTTASGTTSGALGLDYFLGAGYAGTTYSNVIVAEFIIYNRALNASEIDDVTTYLNAKWLTPPLSRSATASGTGTLTATGFKTFTRTATASGTGSLTASGVRTALRSATASGAGTLSATGFKTRTRTATLSGTGSLTAAGLPTHIEPAALSGTGSLSAAGTRTAQRSSSLSGTGTLSATGFKTRSRTATASGTGTLTSTGTRTALRTASLSGTGSLSATGVRTATRSATATATGALTANGTRTAIRTATATGTGSLTASGSATSGSGSYSRTAALTGTGALSASGYKTVVRSVSVTGNGTLNTNGTRTTIRTVSLSGTGTLAATGTRTVTRTAALDAIGTLLATGAIPAEDQPLTVYRVVLTDNAQAQIQPGTEAVLVKVWTIKVDQGTEAQIIASRSPELCHL